MNKQDLIHKLKQLDGLTADEKGSLIELVKTKKKYGLVWEDKPEAVEEQLRMYLPVLKEIKDKRILAKNIPLTNDGEPFEQEEQDRNKPAPNHILIEGDNLHALTALTFTHEGKIDVIYIDPPYNRGENDFKYNDDYIDKENPFKHSLWLSFIYKRLKIAKKLLSETGVMIIHIDEHEFDALNLLMENDLFGESDSLGQIIWNKQNPKGDSKAIATMHEYVLVYAKNKTAFTALDSPLMRAKPNAERILIKAKKLFSKIGKSEIPDEIKEVIKPFNFSAEILRDSVVEYDLDLINKEFQAWLSRQDFSGGEKAYKFIDSRGDVYRGVSMAWPNKEQAPEDYFIPLIHPDTGNPCPVPARGWRNPPNTMMKLIEKNLILFGDDDTKQPERKYLLKENMEENTPSIYNNGGSDDDLLKDMGITFPYPKPTSAAKYFLSCIHPNPTIILDFFAGSGTTLHATMQLNAEDKKQRQCILVTNNENNICEEVTYARNKKVIIGFVNAKGNQIKGLNSNNLRYFKSDFVSSAKNEVNKRMLTQASTELLQIKENCYVDITEPSGFNLSECGIFIDERGKYMIVVYHSRNQNSVCEQLTTYIDNLAIEQPIKLYAFSPEKETLAADFADVADKIEALPLPDAIYNAYRATFRTLRLDRNIVNPAEIIEKDTAPELFDIPTGA
ncbi:DNA methyltransferase [uncultured Mucilaginibacter sp.]|uniref:site-specific DNA-methyltransferase n=1 Tax=uncultured Mucilaginibacter sp. TaxID=797541 RepID=UPI0025D2B473|nr:DNA methyltransferase [uncultured Mucilaginibacter sp.]